MTTKLRNLIASFGFAMGTAACFAAPDMPHGGNPPPPPSALMEQDHEAMPPFLHGVTLSEEQRDKIFEIAHAQAPSLRAREKELQQATERLIKLSQTTDFDDIKAKALADASAKAMSEINLMHARLDNMIFRMLTPEQRKQIESHGKRPRENCGESRMR